MVRGYKHTTPHLKVVSRAKFYCITSKKREVSDVSLNRKQKLAAEIMAAEPLTSGAEIARRVEVDVNTFYRWKKNQEWVDYVHDCCKEEFKSIEKVAINKLKDNVSKGNQKAIEYVLNYMGYQPEQRIDIKNSDININITGEDND